jgi:hypothetical protein
MDLLPLTASELPVRNRDDWRRHYFTHVDVFMATRAALHIQQANRRMGARSVKVSEHSDTEIAMIGSLCEAAVMRMEDLPLVFPVAESLRLLSSERRPDVNGWQVKGSLFDAKDGNGILVNKALFEKDPDKYPLDWRYLGCVLTMDCEHPYCTVKGWAYGWEFIGQEQCLKRNVPQPAYSPTELKRYMPIETQF